MVEILVSLWGPAYFQGLLLLVSGGVIPVGFFFKFRKLMGHWPLPTLQPRFIHEKNSTCFINLSCGPDFPLSIFVSPPCFQGQLVFFFANVFLNGIPSLPDQRRWSSPKKSCEIQYICRQTCNSWGEFQSPERHQRRWCFMGSAYLAMMKGWGWLMHPDSSYMNVESKCHLRGCNKGLTVLFTILDAFHWRPCPELCNVQQKLIRVETLQKTIPSSKQIGVFLV